MATSESDDFESADEELSHDTSSKRNYQQQQWSSPTTIGSESDDDTEYVPRTPRTPSSFVQKTDRFSSPRTAGRTGERTPAKKEATNPKEHSIVDEEKKQAAVNDANESSANMPKEDEKSPSTQKVSCQSATEEETKEKSLLNDDVPTTGPEQKTDSDVYPSKPRREPRERRAVGTKKPGGAHKFGARRLGTKIPTNNDDTAKEVTPKADSDSTSSAVGEEFTESDMPEEMKSDKKFKEIFKPEGWEGLTDEIPEELIAEKLQPVLERLSDAGKETENNSAGWGGWGNWGVSSLINTASAGVSTLTSHVTHGLTLLEESMGVPEAIEPNERKEEEQDVPEKDQQVPEEAQPLSSFGFGNFISGVSSITKLVESTGSKVMSGGLDTLEAIGKKTMEVLQDGDPGLKKKRAFFMNEGQKPNLSKILREAKEKADTAEKSVEEKQRARKIHFESLFDDFQGLVHLEALEMLSKQSNIRIQQHLVNLEGSELDSMQETLEEVKELCDLGDEDENTDEQDEKDLKVKLKEACSDLGVNISYTEKVCPVWEEAESYLTLPITHSDQEIFEYAVSTIAKFTAFAVERFHKTAELILVKERRSTVNEADALVQLTHTLSHEIGVLANMFCDILNKHAKTSEKSEDINANITTIFMEATNASSYIQDAFRLLIPIVQVGAI